MKKFMSLLMLLVIFALSATASEDDKIKKVKDDVVNNTIMDVAVQTEFLSIFVKAIQSADMAATLKGNGPYTIFAPTNEAFNKLPAGTLDELLKPANRAKLREILNNHIVEGRVMSPELSDGQIAKAVGNRDLSIKKVGNQVMVNGATVTTSDVEASNGVIHVVDTVILFRR